MAGAALFGQICLSNWMKKKMLHRTLGLHSLVPTQSSTHLRITTRSISLPPFPSSIFFQGISNAPVVCFSEKDERQTEYAEILIVAYMSFLQMNREDCKNTNRTPHTKYVTHIGFAQAHLSQKNELIILTAVIVPPINCNWCFPLWFILLHSSTEQRN